MMPSRPGPRMSCNGDLRAAVANWAAGPCPGFCAAPDSGTTAPLHPPEHAEGLDRHAAARRALGAGRARSAVRGAAATITRRAGSKSLRTCYPCQNRRRRGFVPAGRPANWGGLAAGAAQRLPGPAAARGAAEAGARGQPPWRCTWLGIAPVMVATVARAEGVC